MANQIGHVELTTTDVAKAKDFYGRMFGWSFEDFPMPQGGTYTMFKAGEGPGGGMMLSPDGVPTVWTMYIIVDDVEKATEQVRALGGSVIRDVTPIPDYGAFSIVADPTGAVIGLFASNSP